MAWSAPQTQRLHLFLWGRPPSTSRGPGIWVVPTVQTHEHTLPQIFNPLPQECGTAHTTGPYSTYHHVAWPPWFS